MYKIVIDQNPNKFTIDQTYLYYPGDPEYVLSDIQLDLNVAEAGQLRFTIYPEHPNYSEIEFGYKHIYVYRDNTIIFNGIISEIERGLDKALTVFCTGILGVLDFTIQPQCKNKGNIAGQPFTLGEYFDDLMAIHNAHAEQNPNSWYKLFVLSNYVEGYNTVIPIRYTNYESTLECLRRDIMEPYGLYPKIDSSIIDFQGKEARLRLVSIENYGNLSTQKVVFSSNLLTYAEDKSFDDTFSAVIPLGKKKDNSERTTDDIPALEAYYNAKSANSGNEIIENAASIAKYGYKCAVVHWEDTTSASTLKSNGTSWLTYVNKPNLRVTLSAIDLSQMGVDYDAFNLGDRVPCVIPQLGFEETLPIYEMSIHPLEPEQNTITLGMEPPTLTGSASTANVSAGASDTRDTIDTLIKIRTWTYTYANVSPNTQIGITANNLRITVPSGYTPIAIQRIAAGNANMLIRAYNAKATEDSAVINFYNNSSSSVSGTATVDIVYIKTEVIER